MSVANVIKSRLARKKKRKIFEDYASGKEGPMKGVEPMEPIEPDEPAKRRAERHKLPEPDEAPKRMEQNPNYQTELKKEDKRTRFEDKQKKKKARKKKAEKPTSEFMEKYYGKDWA